MFKFIEIFASRDSYKFLTVKQHDMALRKAGVSQFDINRYVQMIHEERRRCSNPYDNPSAQGLIKAGEKIYKEYLREQAKIERALESSGYFWKLVESKKI